tara:strand:- start:554 stop:697 length:144 start_codon:yes stop_codon:yes gene_type:complete
MVFKIDKKFEDFVPSQVRIFVDKMVSKINNIKLDKLLKKKKCLSIQE